MTDTKENRGQQKTGISHYILLALGSVLLLAGFLFMWTPIPLGMPLIAFGSILLIRESLYFRDWLRNWRKNDSRVDNFFRLLQRKLPPSFSQSLNNTSPETHPATGESAAVDREKIDP